MKYLNALLKGEEIPPHPREKEPAKPSKGLLQVLQGAHPKGTGEKEQPKDPQRESPTFSPDYRALHQQMTEAIPEDFPFVDAWLADNHPALWRKIRELDDELTRLEQEGAEQRGHRAKLEELFALCQEAKSLKESNRERETRGRVLAVHHCGGTRFWLSAYSDLWICERCSPPPERGAAKRWVEAGEEITEGVCFVQ